MKHSPAVVIHNLAQARRVIATGLPVTLLSSPGAACTMGPLWWQQILIQSGFPGPALLDCADAPGRALDALKLGLAGIILTGPAAALPAVAAIAAAQGAVMLTAAPPALDLGRRHPPDALKNWLAG